MLKRLGFFAALVFTACSASALAQSATDSAPDLQDVLGSSSGNSTSPSTPAPGSDAATDAQAPATVSGAAAPDNSAAPTPVSSQTAAAPAQGAGGPADSQSRQATGDGAASPASGSGASGGVGKVAANTSSKAKKRNPLIEEIVVTAEKRSENLEDVPISVSAFSGKALAAEGITSPQGMAQSVPGVYYGQTVNFAIIYIRGVGTDAFLPDSDPSVATYVDGIYFPFANGLSQAFGAIKRIEVLKGPQGTLFGRNSTGGAFNIITKSPGKDFDASAEVSFGNYDDIKRRAYLSVPLTDSLAISTSLIYNTARDYYSGTRGDGVDAGHIPLPRDTSRGARGQLRWDILDNLQLNAATLFYRQAGLGTTAIPNTDPSLATTALGLLGTGTNVKAPFDSYTVNVDVPSYFSVYSRVYYGNIQYHPKWFDVKLLGSEQKITTDNVYDFDGTDAPFITFDAKDQFADIQTAEAQIQSNDTFGPRWWKWIFGAYYLHQDSGFPLNKLSVGNLNLSDGNILGVIPVPQGLLNILDQVPGVPDGVTVGLVSELFTKSYSFYTQHTFDLTDWAHFTLGGRYQKDTRHVIASTANLVNLDGSLTPLHTVPPAPPEKSNVSFSPKIEFGINPLTMLGYDDADRMLTYVSWTKGFKSGTFDTVNVYNGAEYVQPEVVQTYELGLKSEWWDGLFRFNMALFDNKIKNLQVQFISLLAGGAVSLENAGGADIKGAEFDTQISPFPDLDPGLVFGVSGTYLHSRYTSYVDGSGYSVNAQGTYAGAGVYNFRTGNYTGNQVTHTPKFSGTAHINQIYDIGPGEFTFGAKVYYNSGFYYLADNVPTSYQGSYYTLDAHLSYLYKPFNTTVTVYGKNLTSSIYTESEFHTDAGRQSYLGAPRTYGLTLQWEY